MTHIKRTSSYHHGELSRTCIDIALSFLEEGNSDFSLRDVAKAAQVSHGAPLRHFRNKENFLSEVAKTIFQELNQVLELASKSLDPEQAALSMAKAYVKFAIENPAKYELIFGSRIANHADYPDLEAEGRKAYAQMLSVITLLQSHKIIAEQDLDMIALNIWSGIHGISSLAIGRFVMVKIDSNGVPMRPSTHSDEEFSIRLEQLVESQIQLIFKGLK